MERADIAAALHQGNNRPLVDGGGSFFDWPSAFRGGAALRSRAVVSFVRLDNLAAAAHGPEIVAGHGFADAVRHEPSRLVIELERPMQLVRRDTLFAGLHEVE